MLIGIYGNFSFIRSVLVVHNKVKVAKVFVYTMNKPQMGTALPALMAFKRDSTRLLVPYWVSTLKKGPGSQVIYPCHTILSLIHGRQPFTR